MAARFEILEHTADIGFRAHGATLEQVFEHAAEAMMFIAVEPEAISARERYTLDADGEDREALLVNFLNEVLFLLDGRRIGMRDFRVLDLTPEHVRAEALGEPLDPVRHRAKLVVKAVTYHQLRIERDHSGWHADVYLDI